MFFSSISFGLDYAVLLFGGIGSISLGFILKRSTRKRRSRRFEKRRSSREVEDED
jgi:hypothetical protein